MHIMAHFPIFDLPIPALLSLHIMPVYLSLISLSLSCLCKPLLISFLLYALPHYPVVAYHASHPVIDFIVSCLRISWLISFLLHTHPRYPVVEYHACLPVIDFFVSICAAKALFSCPAIISQRLESRILSNEPLENTEEESKVI